MALYGLAAGATVVTLHVYRGGSGRGCGGHGNFTVDVVRCVPSLRPPSLSRPALLRPFDPVPQPLRHFLSGAPHPTGSLLAAPARPRSPLHQDWRTADAGWQARSGPSCWASAVATSVVPGETTVAAGHRPNPALAALPLVWRWTGHGLPPGSR